MASRIQTFSIIGHRGAPQLEPPGNTVASLRRAIAVGADMLEVDVRRTRDDVLVLYHEAVHWLDGREVPIQERPYAEWKSYADEIGAPLATLDDAFTIAAQASVGLLLDFKVVGTEALLARAIRRSGFPLERLLVAGADETSRKILRGLDPRIPLSLSLDSGEAALVTPKLLAELDTDAVTWHPRLINPAIVTILHRREIIVYGGVADLADEMRRLRDICGVDGILTDAPDLLSTLPRA